MWQSPLHLDKYQYARTNPYIVRIIGVLGICTTLLMGYGLLRYLKLNNWYLFLFGPIILIFLANKLMRFFVQLFYQKFDIKKHEQFTQQYWTDNPEPPVNIFLPYAGEDLDVHEEVLKAAADLDYKNYKVYMLDDGNNPGHKQLAEKYGFIYLSRPNKGEFKKSGNLQYGYDHSDGEFILILDADFIPIKSILKDLIPYIASDPKIGILQTPQYFEQTKEVHSRSKIEFGGGNIVEDFYRVILPCRDEFKAAMCVGTSAIYRRTAIMKLDGTPKVHASEDLATGLLITQHGFYVKYLPLIVSMGKSPETYQGYFKQHLRWCSGNLVFAKYWPNARLSLVARLIYMINPMYYLSEALTVVFSFQFLLLLYFHSESLSIIHSLYFLPYVVLSRVIVPLTKTNKNKVGTKLAALSNSYTYFYTYIRMLTKGVPSWHPTGVKFQGLHQDFISSINIGTFISSIYIILFLFVLITKPGIFGNFNTYAVLGWGFYSVFWHALFLYLVALYIHPFKLANIQSTAGKAWLYLRTHFILGLAFIMVGLATFNTATAFSNPNTPTSKAISGLLENDQSQTNSLASDSKPVENNVTNIQPEVLATTTQNSLPEPKQTYPILIKSGDNLTKLAKLAVDEYASDQTILLTQPESNYAVNKLVSNIKDRKPLRPGKEFIFNADQIAESIQLAKAYSEKTTKKN